MINKRILLILFILNLFLISFYYILISNNSSNEKSRINEMKKIEKEYLILLKLKEYIELISKYPLKKFLFLINSQREINFVIDGLNFVQGGILVLWMNLIYEFSKFNFINIYVISHGIMRFPESIGNSKRIQIIGFERDSKYIIENKLKLKKNETFYFHTYYLNLKGYCNILMIYDTIAEEYNMIKENNYHWHKMNGILKDANSIISISNWTTNITLKYYPNISSEIIKTTSARANLFYNQKLNDSILKKYNLQKFNYFLYVGTRPFGKGVEDILEAFYRIPENIRNNFTMILIGSSIRRDWESKYLNITRVLDNIDYNEMPYLYSFANSLIFTTVYRGFGMPVYEALACGCPVIVYSDWNFIHSNAAEFVYKKKDSNEIKNAILKMMDLNYRNNKVKDALLESERYTGNNGWNQMALDILNHIIFGKQRGNECKIQSDYLKK